MKSKICIPVNELEPFYNYCKNEIKLNIIGLMIIPPNDNNYIKYFKSLYELNKSLALQDLSMGMSADYIEAIKYGATFIRVGVLFLSEILIFVFGLTSLISLIKFIFLLQHILEFF